MKILILFLQINLLIYIVTICRNKIILGNWSFLSPLKEVFKFYMNHNFSFSLRIGLGVVFFFHFLPVVIIFLQPSGEKLHDGMIFAFTIIFSFFLEKALLYLQEIFEDKYFFKPFDWYLLWDLVIFMITGITLRENIAETSYHPLLLLIFLLAITVREHKSIFNPRDYISNTQVPSNYFYIFRLVNLYILFIYLFLHDNLINLTLIHFVVIIGKLLLVLLGNFLIWKLLIKLNEKLLMNLGHISIFIILIRTIIFWNLS